MVGQKTRLDYGRVEEYDLKKKPKTFAYNIKITDNNQGNLSGKIFCIEKTVQQ